MAVTEKQGHDVDSSLLAAFLSWIGISSERQPLPRGGAALTKRHLAFSSLTFDHSRLGFLKLQRHSNDDHASL